MENQGAWRTRGHGEPGGMENQGARRTRTKSKRIHTGEDHMQLPTKLSMQQGSGPLDTTPSEAENYNLALTKTQRPSLTRAARSSLVRLRYTPDPTPEAH
uniref:Uncharacterized protein n=1 Tax=Knipowitschia caucasica TaxID=637954 RepID=A0AAV2L1N0_KNICA